MKKVITMDEAMDLIKDGDTIWVNSFGGCASPIDLNKAITYRFRATGHPKHLTVYSAFSFAEWREDSDVEGWICEGGADCAVIGFFGSLSGYSHTYSGSFPHHLRSAALNISAVILYIAGSRSGSDGKTHGLSGMHLESCIKRYPSSLRRILFLILSLICALGDGDH